MAQPQAGPSSRTPLLQAHHATRHSPSLTPSRPPYPSQLSTSSNPPPESYTEPPSRATSPYPSRPYRKRRRRTPPLPVLPTVVLLTCAALLVFAAWDVSSVGNCYFPSICRALGKGKGRKDEVYARNTGAYAPYVSQGPGGGRVNLPRGCEINQVNIVSLVTPYCMLSGEGEGGS